MPSSSFFSGTNPTPTEYQTAVDLVAQATQQATAALASQSAAAASAQSSQGYSVSAGESATTATNQASSAASSAAGAANSATAAATSATNASNSATAASTSATNAANSATAASTSATNAASSASAATSSASAAATSETNAAASAASAASTLASALVKTNNLSDLSNVASARSNLGLVASATTDTTNASNISSGTLSNSRLSGVLLTANNLSEVNAASARSNLGLSTVAATGAYSDLSGRPALVASATTDTTNASNISSGTLDAARLPAISLTTGVSGTLPVANGGTGTTTSTGTGSVVLSNSPTLVTPALGTPASGNLSNCTFPTLNQNTTGTASNVTGTVGVANGGTGLTSLTAGRIPYGAGTGAFGNSANLFWDGTNLGVGTSSPTNISGFRSVTINDPTNGGFVDLQTNGVTGTRLYTSGGLAYLYNQTNNALVFGTNGTERMRLDASGNLGLGVVPSAWGSGTRAIEIGASSSVSNIGTTTGISVGSNIYRDASVWKYKLSSEKSALYNQYNGAHEWFTAGSGSAGGTISFTQAMTLDASGRLGVGVTSPSYLLDVYNASTAADYYAGRISSVAAASGTSITHLRLEKGSGYGGTVGGYLSQGVGSGLVFSTLNGGTLANAMWINNSGNVGIGTSSPSYKLEVNGTLYSTGYTLGGGGYPTQNFYPTSGTANQRAFRYVAGGGSFSFISIDDSGTQVNYPVTVYWNGNTQFGGNVGIGTSSPGAKLHVAGGAGSTIRNDASSGSCWFVGSNANSYILHNESNTPMLFTTNGTERARIDSSGNFLIGDSAAFGKFRVYNNTSNTGARIDHVVASGSYSALYLNIQTTTSPLTIYAYQGTTVGSVTTNATSTTYNTSSDISLKENVGYSANCLPSILALPIRQFDWKADGSHTDYGVVAQEAYEYAPEMVTQGELWSVDYGRITPRLIKAFQELAAKVTALEAANG